MYRVDRNTGSQTDKVFVKVFRDKQKVVIDAAEENLRAMSSRDRLTGGCPDAILERQGFSAPDRLQKTVCAEKVVHIILALLPILFAPMMREI